MDRIYSVLIQNKKTMDLFQQFQPLFMEALNEGRISLCKWLESGTAIDTALPELCDIVNDKEEWRAIIIRVEDEEAMSEFETNPLNPFDFKIPNSYNKVKSFESPVPLVRLSHMLTDVPQPAVEYRTEYQEDEYGKTHVVSVPYTEEYDENEYERLCEKYSFDGKKPTEIWLVSVRQDCRKSKEKALLEYGNANEYKQNGFCARNNYPSECRFMLFDLTKQGATQRTAELLEFWTSILILATNNIPASSLQAYSLYKIGTDIDRKCMAEVFQNKLHYLHVADNCIGKFIERENEKKILDAENVTVPEFAMDVDVAMNPVTADNVYVGEGIYSPTTEDRESDVDKWSRFRPEAEKTFARLVVTMDRAVDQTAASLSGHCEYPDALVKPLNEYQKEDLLSSLDKTRSEIIALRNQLPEQNSECAKKLLKADNRVKDDLKVRITNSQIGKGFLMMTIIMLMCNVPAIAFYAKTKSGNPAFLFAFVLIEVIFLALMIPIVLFAQHSKLKASIQNYNKCILARVDELNFGLKLYSKYLSKIASHMKGSSYINTIDSRKYNADNSLDKYKEHQNAISKFIYLLKMWGNSLHLNVDYTPRVDNNEEYFPNVNIAAQINPEYTVEYGNEYEISLLPSGEKLISPLAYVKSFTVAQEELHDGTEYNI